MVNMVSENARVSELEEEVRSLKVANADLEAKLGKALADLEIANALSHVAELQKTSPKKVTKEVTTAQSSTPPPRRHAAPTVSPQPQGRGGGYGLDAELEKKRLEKYDPAAEKYVVDWISEKTGHQPDAPFGDWLHDGTVLCDLANALKPNSVKKIATSRLAFKQMENISLFLKATRALGVEDHSVFETVDLYEQKDLGLVVQCLLALKARVN